MAVHTRRAGTETVRRAPTMKALLAVNALVVLAGVAIIAWLIVLQVAAPPFDPLGDYAVQRVVNPLRPGDTAVVLAPGEAADVRGTKCNQADRPVKVRGSYGWSSVDPGGSYVAVIVNAENQRAPGCTTQTFRNDMPDGVTDLVARWARDGVFRSVWKITGTELPIEPESGAYGVPRVWVTDNFTIDTTVLPRSTP